ncbi:MFS transporter [Microbacterium sp. MAHUQ-60]|uniref:MFS transporter n=1 Tax=unclassified Microbacterium TaxID=2609290 RepID=UPI003617FF81
MTTTFPRLWRQTPYLLWLTSDTGKGLAATLFSFAVPLLALVITNDPAQAGVVAAVGTVVRLLATLTGGVLADRHRRIVMMALGAGIAAIAAGAFTATAVAGGIDFLALLLFEVVLAAISGLFGPAGEAALKDIVPEQMMGRAQAANQGRDAALQLAGGPIGGMLLAAGGWLIGAAMMLSSLISAVAAWALGRRVGWARAGGSDADAGAGAGGNAGADAGAVPGAVDAEAGAVASADPVLRANGLRELREGVRWLFRRPDLSTGTVVATVINLGLNAGITTMIYAVLQAGYSEATIGWMMAASGAAMLVGALLAPSLVPRIGAGMLMILGLSACTAAMVGGVFVETPWGVALLICAAVFLIPALNAAFSGYTMVATPSALIGRVNSVGGVLSMGAMPLSPLIAGFGLAWAGRTSTLIFSLALCAIALIMGVTSRALRSIPAEAGWAEHAKQYEQPVLAAMAAR